MGSCHRGGTFKFVWRLHNIQAGRGLSADVHRKNASAFSIFEKL